MHYFQRSFVSAAPVMSRRSRQATRRGHVTRPESAVLPEASCAEQLARFFPQVAPVQIAAHVIAVRRGGKQLKEMVTVQFSGREHAIFVSSLPIEFNDAVRLMQQEGQDTVEGSVVAVQYEEGRKAVAVRFAGGRGEWLARR